MAHVLEASVYAWLAAWWKGLGRAKLFKSRQPKSSAGREEPKVRAREGDTVQ